MILMDIIVVPDVPLEFYFFIFFFVFIQIFKFKVLSGLNFYTHVHFPGKFRGVPWSAAVKDSFYFTNK